MKNLVKRELRKKKSLMNISFSAIDTFIKCPFSYKLKYYDKVEYERGSLFTAFGKAIHKTIYLKLLDDNIDLIQIFKQSFKEELKELSENQLKKIFSKKETKEIVSDMSKKGANLCQLSLEKLKEQFPDFKLVAAEKEFIEPITEYTNKDFDFKGVIDLIIETPDNKTHIIDWKATSWGWDARKKNDKMITYQLTFYKHFYGLQSEKDNKDIETHFALIKRTAKKDNIEIFKVPVGEKKINNALKVLNNVMYNIDHQRFPKNRLSCNYCDFHHTEWCP